MGPPDPATSMIHHGSSVAGLEEPKEWRVCGTDSAAALRAMARQAWICKGERTDGRGYARKRSSGSG